MQTPARPLICLPLTPADCRRRESDSHPLGNDEDGVRSRVRACVARATAAPGSRKSKRGRAEALPHPHGRLTRRQCATATLHTTASPRARPTVALERMAAWPSNRQTSSVDATVRHRGAADRLMAEALTVIAAARRHGARIRLTGGPRRATATPRTWPSWTASSRTSTSSGCLAESARLQRALAELGYAAEPSRARGDRRRQFQYLRPRPPLESHAAPDQAAPSPAAGRNVALLGGRPPRRLPRRDAHGPRRRPATAASTSTR